MNSGEAGETSFLYLPEDFDIGQRFNAVLP